MEQQLKQRLSGTIALVAVAVIVLPLLLDGEGYRAIQNIEIDAPQRPKFGYRQEGFTIPLKDLNEPSDPLDPPPPIDVKGFNGEAVELPETMDGHEETSAEMPSDAPDSSAELTTTWVMQIGSFNVKENAFTARKKLEAMKAKNTIIEIETEMVDGREVYVVKIVSDDYEALSKVATLIKKDYPDAFIKERE